MKRTVFARGLTFIFVFLFLGFSVAVKAEHTAPADRILGKWIAKEKNLIVEVYRAENTYRARIVWFSDHDDLSRPMATRTDYHNPDPALRKRKLIGMDVLSGLSYSSGTASWENGLIYDANSGKEWSSCISLNKDGGLCVKGYWHFKCLCKSMDFLPYNG